MSMNFTDAIVLAVERVKAWVNENKQDKLTGTEGQIVGFNAEGKPVAQEASGGGASHWDQLEGKPFVKIGGDTLTWDGNTEGLVALPVEGGTFYKVSEVAPAMDLVVGGTYSLADENSFEITADDVVDVGEISGMAELAGVFMIVPVIYIYPKDIIVEGNIIEKGTYFFEGSLDSEMDTLVRSLTIPGYTGFTKEQIDPKVLPGAVVLYTDGTYLYSDSDVDDATKRITKVQLMELMPMRNEIVINPSPMMGGVDAIRLFPIAFNLIEGFSGIIALDFMSETIASKAYYTAEYTA